MVTTLRRWAGGMAIWAAMALGVAAVVAAAWWPRFPVTGPMAGGRASASGDVGELSPPDPRPLRGEYRGLSPEEVVDRLDRQEAEKAAIMGRRGPVPIADAGDRVSP